MVDKTVTSSPRVVASAYNRIELFAIGPSNTLVWKSYKDGSWTNWRDLEGGLIYIILL